MCTGNHPIILSKVRLLGKCNKGSLFTSPKAPITPTEAPASSPPTSPPTSSLTRYLTHPPTQAPTRSPTSLST